MKDFDKIFSEKLYQHKTPPPAELWDAMDEALEHEQNKKNKIILLRFAAAVALLLLAGSLLWIKESAESPVQLSEERQTSPDRVEPFLQQQPDALALEDINERMEEKEEPAARQVEILPENPSMIADQYVQPSGESSDQTTAAEAKNTTPKKVLPNKLEKINPIQPVLAESHKNKPVTLATLPVNPETVTIIFKPGKPKHNAESAKPLEMLADIKNSGISFAEIRSAKSDLLAKVFNKLDQDIIR
jgi:hypothetical protein